jgi:hypothetical protein
VRRRERAPALRTSAPRAAPLAARRAPFPATEGNTGGLPPARLLAKRGPAAARPPAPRPECRAPKGSFAELEAGGSTRRESSRVFCPAPAALRSARSKLFAQSNSIRRSFQAFLSSPIHQWTAAASRSSGRARDPVHPIRTRPGFGHPSGRAARSGLAGPPEPEVGLLCSSPSPAFLSSCHSSCLSQRQRLVRPFRAQSESRRPIPGQAQAGLSSRLQPSESEHRSSRD